MRLFKFRLQQTFGLPDDLEDTEYRSYKDGTIRRFQHRTQADGKQLRELEGSRTVTEQDWKAFLSVLDKTNAWSWKNDDIMPFPDASTWSLRVVDGDRELRVDEWAAYPDTFDEVSEAIDRLVFGSDASSRSR